MSVCKGHFPKLKQIIFVVNISGADKMAGKEEDLYLPIVRYIKDELKDHSLERYHVEITSSGVFSKYLLTRFKIIEEIQELLPRKLMPDITGFFKDTEIFVMEVKNRPLALEDIYQVKCYAELIDSDVALLMSPFDFSASDRRLLQRRCDILQLPNQTSISIGLFNEKIERVENWYPRRPW